MQTLSEIRSLLAARGIRPKHRFGQNFLHDHQMLRRLVEASGVGPGSTVLEVGPGTGALTEALLESGARVIACEIDRDMIAVLEERVRPLARDRLAIVPGDCLDGKHALSSALADALAASDSDADADTAPSFTLVANLPYGSATPLMATLLANHPECTGQFVTIQREVADRLAAEPRSDAYGPLTVTVQLLAEVSTLGAVSPGCFWPAPEVTSAMVALRPRPSAARPADLRTPDETRAFGAFVTRVFSRRRKQLGTTLGRDHPLPPGIAATQRPEELAPGDWLELWRLARGRAPDPPPDRTPHAS